MQPRNNHRLTRYKARFLFGAALFLWGVFSFQSSVFSCESLGSRRSRRTLRSFYNPEAVGDAGRSPFQAILQLRGVNKKLSVFRGVGMFPVGIINVCCGMIPCGKRLMGGMLSGGFATLNRPAKFGFFLTEKLGECGRAAFQQPLQLRGEGWEWGGRPSRRPYATRWRIE